MNSKSHGMLKLGINFLRGYSTPIHLFLRGRHPRSLHTCRILYPHSLSTLHSTTPPQTTQHHTTPYLKHCTLPPEPTFHPKMAPPTPITPLSNHPLPSQSSLGSQYIGRSISTDEGIPTPAVILDRAVLQRNCDAMLRACEALGVGFRAHVKSHKVC